MIEYIVVLAFGVIILMQGGNSAPVKQVATAIKDYHEHYSYAMSIAYIPDCDYQLSLDKSTTLGDIVTLTGGATIGFDRCIDWTNPKIPDISISNFIAKLDLTDNIKDAVQKIITDTIKDSIDGFLDPSNLLSDMVGFKPSDFF